MKHLYITFISLFALSIITISCGGSDDGGSVNDGGNGNGNGNFSYTDIGPNLGSQWIIYDARRSDTGLWALYNNSDSDANKLARYDFSSKQWEFWDFEQGIKDFDVWLEGEDNGNGAVVMETINNIGGVEVRSLSSAAPWDIEDIEWQKRHIALGWGAGSAAFTNWIGEGNTGHHVYQQTGTCCPLQWNEIDAVPSSIHNMWASSRQDGYVLVSTADKFFIVYSDGGAEITFDGNSAAIEKLAWDTQTRIPYVLLDGILYQIEVNPNAHTAQAVEAADLTALNFGVTIGSVPLDIRNGKAFVPYDGAVVNLSNGSIETSWIGSSSATNIEAMILIQSIASSRFMFSPPNDQDGVFAHIDGADATWIRVNSAL